MKKLLYCLIYVTLLVCSIVSGGATAQMGDALLKTGTRSVHNSLNCYKDSCKQPLVIDGLFKTFSANSGQLPEAIVIDMQNTLDTCESLNQTDSKCYSFFSDFYKLYPSSFKGKSDIVVNDLLLFTSFVNVSRETIYFYSSPDADAMVLKMSVPLEGLSVVAEIMPKDAPALFSDTPETRFLRTEAGWLFVEAGVNLEKAKNRSRGKQAINIVEHVLKDLNKRDKSSSEDLVIQVLNAVAAGIENTSTEDTIEASQYGLNLMKGQALEQIGEYHTLVSSNGKYRKMREIEWVLFSALAQKNNIEILVIGENNGEAIRIAPGTDYPVIKKEKRPADLFQVPEKQLRFVIRQGRMFPVFAGARSFRQSDALIKQVLSSRMGVAEEAIKGLHNAIIDNDITIYFSPESKKRLPDYYSTALSQHIDIFERDISGKYGSRQNYLETLYPAFITLPTNIYGVNIYAMLFSLIAVEEKKSVYLDSGLDDEIIALTLEEGIPSATLIKRNSLKSSDLDKSRSLYFQMNNKGTWQFIKGELSLRACLEAGFCLNDDIIDSFTQEHDISEQLKHMARIPLSDNKTFCKNIDELYNLWWNKELGIQKNIDNIKKKYKNIVLDIHPDKNKNRHPQEYSLKSDLYFKFNNSFECYKP